MQPPTIDGLVRDDDARVRCDVDGPVATITLARPDRRNAQTPATWIALGAIGAKLPGDVRVVVVRGEGTSFSAGLDRAMLAPEGPPGAPTFLEIARGPAHDAERLVETFQAGFSWLGRPGIVSIAAVRGHAIGAGFQLALACDLRIAADDAVFRMAETSLGLVPDLGGTGALRDVIGFSRALEICATGRDVAAEEAERIGLVNRVVPGDALDDAVLELTRALLASPAAAVAETKALLLSAARSDPADQLRAERRAQIRRLRDLAGVHE